MEDGDILSLAPGSGRGGRQRAGRQAGAGRQPADAAGGGVMSARRRMLFNGVVLASLAVDAAGTAARRAAGQRAGPVRRRTIRSSSASPASSPMRSPTCRRRCAATMRRWPMPRVRRCGARWAGGCRSGRWWMCICCGSRPRSGMNWFTGVVLYILIWWTVLFAVLPIGTRPVEDADAADRLARRAGASAAADEGDHHDAGRSRGLVRRLAADHQRLRELPPRLVRRTPD